jgi:hypothetical protein
LSGDGEEIESSRREKGKEITPTCPPATSFFLFLFLFSIFLYFFKKMGGPALLFSIFLLFFLKWVGQPGQVPRQAGRQNRP